MSVTTVSNAANVLKNRRPNSTHLDQLDKLLETDLYKTEKEVSTPTFTSSAYYKVSHPSDSTLKNCELISDVEPSEVCGSRWTSDEEVKRRRNSNETTIYANLSEIESKKRSDFIDRQPFPPEPNPTEEPIRAMQNGWREYKTIGGRSYFFHSQSGERQWQPPRSSKGFSTLSKSKTSEPKKTKSISEMSSSSAATPLWVDVPKSKSMSTDQPNCSPDVYVDALHLDEANTQATNSIEHEFRLPDAPRRLDAADNFTYHRQLPRTTEVSNNQEARNRVVDNEYVNFDEPGTSTVRSDSIISSQPGTTSSFMTTTFPVLSVDMSSSLPAVNSLSSSIRSHDYFTPGSAIHQGTLEKCRVSDRSAKIKKNQWTNTFAFLYSGHLLFYRDQKSAEKTGKHYPPPMDVCDLRGAKLSKVDNEKYKDKRHRQIISLQLANNSVYLFSSVDNESETNEWFRALTEAIISSPYSSAEVPSFNDQGSLGRLSHKSGAFKKQSTRHSLKSATKSSTTNKEKAETEIPLRESIIDRLLRFLRSRPTLESLTERGIYRPEPVFGSTLAAVCEHDGSSVPRFVSEVTEMIEKRGLLMDGIYRVSGNLSSIQKLRCHIDQDRYDALGKEEDVHVLTGALKLFLRELADPLFPADLNKEFMSAMKEQPRGRLKIFDDLLKRLPEPNRATLATLIVHLRRVSRHSSENRMQIHNLAIVFGPAFFHSESRTVKTHQRRNSGFLSKKAAPPPEQRVVPSQNLAYKMVVFGQVTEFLLNEADKFQIFSKLSL